MAGAIKNMSMVKQLLQHHKQGVAIKRIATILEISKNTVKSYLAKLEALSLPIDTLLRMDDMQLEAMFHSGNPSFKTDERYDDFIARLPYFNKQLENKMVTRYLLWSEYIEQYPQGYRYTQFNFHLNQQKLASKPSMVLTHEPGDKLFIDFTGDKIAYCDTATGELIYCEVFVATLAASDYCFAIVVPSQKSEDFLYALRKCLEFIGGVPRAIVPDNLKSAVTKTSRYEPDINRSLADFANHYGTSIVPARSYKPKDKALVENQVKNIYRRVFAPLRNITFFDLPSLNKAVTEQIHKHNQTRMQQKPYTRQEYFIAEEKELLAMLPSEPFEIKHYKEYKVAKNNHIYLSEDKHYYSVPYSWIGATVMAIYTRTMVRIYAKGEQIAVHPRSQRPGHYTSTEDHLCSAHKAYRDRSPDYYIAKAERISPTFKHYFTLLFAQKYHPEQIYNQCEGLLSLARKNDTGILDKACEKSMDVGYFSYNFIRNIIKSKMVNDQQTETQEPLPKHENIRGSDYYNKNQI
jgi:transposase